MNNIVLLRNNLERELESLFREGLCCNEINFFFVKWYVCLNLVLVLGVINFKYLNN